MENIREYVERRWSGFTVKAHIDRVFSGSNWYTVVFVSNGDENRILYLHADAGEWLADYEYTNITDENGNLFYKQVKAAGKTDAQGIYYDGTKTVLNVVWKRRVEALPLMKTLETVVNGRERLIRI